MSPLSAQIISAITALIAIFAVMVPLQNIRRGTIAASFTGISPEGFDRRDIIIGAFLFMFYSITPLTAFCTSPQPQSAANMTVGGIFANSLLQGLILLSIIVRLSSRKLRENAGWGRFISFRQLLLIILAMMIPAVCCFILDTTGIADWIAKATNSSHYQDSVKQLQNGSIPIKIAISISAIIIAPFLEELGFRGYLYPLLKKFSTPPFACLITSLLFGIVHMNLVMFIPLTLFGAALVFIYEKTRSIWAPITTHMIFNSISVINILFIETTPLT